MGKKIDLSKSLNNSNLKFNKNTRPVKSNYSNDENNQYADGLEESIYDDQPPSENIHQAIQSNIKNPNSLNQNFNGKNIKKWWDDTPIEYKTEIIMKHPMTKKIILIVVIMAIILIFIVYFIMVITGSSASSSSAEYFAINGKCNTITVVDSGCNSNAENCTHEYDGEVEFEDYVAGVVSAELGSGLPLEYYKMQAITSRTFVLSHIDSSCTVRGNATYQVYKDVEDSASSETIKQAVKETEGLVMEKNGELSGGHFASACVVNADDDYYYVRYGSISYGEPQIQKIPKEFDTSNIYNGYLAYWYSLVDKSNTDYYNKSCPQNHDYGMTAIGALYLIQEENYSYEEVLKYYYGDELEIKTVNAPNSDVVEGFINPVNNSSCTSGYGCRLHPIHNKFIAHYGIDLGAASGTPIYAPKDGVIIDVYKSVPGYSETYGCGNLIYIDHQDGTKTRYCHLLYESIPDNIEIGATVEQGEIIGLVGSTGTSTGPHLHYEVYVNGKLQNPINYLDLSKIGNQNKCDSNASVPLDKCGL